MENFEDIQNDLLRLCDEIEEYRSNNTEAIHDLAWKTIQDNMKSAVRTIDLVRHALEGR